MEITCRKFSLIYSWLTDIVSVSLFYSVTKLAFIIWSISKFFSSSTMWFVSFPPTRIFIVLERIIINSFSMCFIILYVSFIDTTVIEDIPSFYCCLASSKTSLVIRTILEIELSAAVKFITCPLASIITLWSFVLFIWVWKYAFRKRIRIF